MFLPHTGLLSFSTPFIRCQCDEIRDPNKPACDYCEKFQGAWMLFSEANLRKLPQQMHQDLQPSVDRLAVTDLAQKAAGIRSSPNQTQHKHTLTRHKRSRVLCNKAVYFVAIYTFDSTVFIWQLQLDTKIW